MPAAAQGWAAGDFDLLIKLQPDGALGIEENTKSEHVLVGSDNRMLRWAWTTTSEDQRFGYGTGPCTSVAVNPSGKPLLVKAASGEIQYLTQDLRVYDDADAKSDPYVGEFYSEFPRRCFPLK